jgi:hypothetical protein
MAQSSNGISRANRATCNGNGSNRGGRGGNGREGNGSGRGRGRGRSTATAVPARQIPAVPVRQIPARQIMTGGGSLNISTMTSPLVGTTASSMASSPASAVVPQVFLDPEEEEFLYDFASFQLNSGAADSEDEDDLVGHDEEHEQEINEHMEESFAALFGQGDYVESSADPNPDENGISI